MFSLLDWLFGWKEAVQLRAEIAFLKQQHEEDLESLAIQHNRLAQEVYHRQKVEAQLAVCRAQTWNSGPLKLQPIIIYPSAARPPEPWLPPPGAMPVPMEPVVRAFEEMRDWVAQELGQPIFKLLPLLVVWSPRSLAAFQALDSQGQPLMIAECRQVVWDDLKLPQPPAPQPHLICLVRGMGGFAGTLAADWQAPIVGLGDACLEALAGLQRPYAMDRIHPDWPEEYKTREGQKRAALHEFAGHGLLKNREEELGYTGAGGHPPVGSPDDISILGQYALPQAGYTDRLKQIILENLKGA